MEINQEELRIWKIDGNLTTINDFPSIAILSHVYEQVGLIDSTGMATDHNKALTQLNDGGNTWPEIAAIVRANPEHFFTKSV